MLNVLHNNTVKRKQNNLNSLNLNSIITIQAMMKICMTNFQKYKMIIKELDKSTKVFKLILIKGLESLIHFMVFKVPTGVLKIKI